MAALPPTKPALKSIPMPLVPDAIAVTLRYVLEFVAPDVVVTTARASGPVATIVLLRMVLLWISAVGPVDWACAITPSTVERPAQRA